MPSVGHLAVGLAAGRWRAAEGPRLRVTIAFTFLALFPDADVLTGSRGGAAGSPWLHRGASHSLIAAAVAALVVSLILEGRRLRAGTLAAAFLTAASHGVLDTLTHGGAGVMLLWPFSHARWLAPWAPVPASPMGARLFSAHGLLLMARELVLFAPLALYALWPRPRRRVTAPLGVDDSSPPIG